MLIQNYFLLITGSLLDVFLPLITEKMKEKHFAVLLQAIGAGVHKVLVRSLRK